MKRLGLLLALLAAGAPLSAADMYSWVDANGVKHFSDSPPPPNVGKVQKLKVKGGVTTTAPNEEPPKDSGPALAAAAGYSPDDIRRNCDIAKKNLQTLDAQKLPVDADGDPLDPSAAKDHQAQVDKANQQIKLFCTSK
ncbi:MAG TPA: DUF4124 domain-containing protein [Dokdonella sp.]